MRPLFQLLALFSACPKKMLTFKSFPAGTLHIHLYCFEQEKTFLYDMPDMDTFEEAVMKDWGHLIQAEVKPAPLRMADFL